MIGGVLLLPPPHPTIVRQRAKANHLRVVLQRRRDGMPTKNTPANNPPRLVAQSPIFPGAPRRVALCEAVVLIVRTVVPPLTTEAALKEHVASEGRPEQEVGAKPTDPAKFG
jgi:hypothetical protein